MKPRLAIAARRGFRVERYVVLPLLGAPLACGAAAQRRSGAAASAEAILPGRTANATRVRQAATTRHVTRYGARWTRTASRVTSTVTCLVGRVNCVVGQ